MDATQDEDPSGEAAAAVIGRAAMTKPDCGKCGHVERGHGISSREEGALFDGVAYCRARIVDHLVTCDCDGYEPIMAGHDPSTDIAAHDPSTDIGSHRDHGGPCCGHAACHADPADIGSDATLGGQLASLHPDDQRAMQTALRLLTLKEALAVCIAERNERSYRGGLFSWEQLDHFADFTTAADALRDCIRVKEDGR
jgi:hypothetical protein